MNLLYMASEKLLKKWSYDLYQDILQTIIC